MLKFNKVKVDSFDLDNFVVTWEVSVNPATRDVSEFEFYIQRSNAQDGPYLELNSTPLVDTYFYIDNEINRLSKWRRFFYKVRAVDTVNSEEFISEPTFIAIPSLNIQQRVRLEIIRTERVLLQGAGVSPGTVGARCLAFTRRTFGQRCPDCWDPIKKKVASSRCTGCFGVGFGGGYHTPILVYVNFQPTKEVAELSPIGEMQPNVVNAWTSNFPPFSAGDILIDQENVRWRVVNQTRTEQLRLVTRQMLELYHIQPGDIEYQITFDTSLFDS